MNAKRRLFSVLSIIFIFSGFPSVVFAESVFMKDGSIIEGKVVKDSARSVTVNFSDKSSKEILRKDILRIIFDEEYKIKRYIYKMDGTSLEAFIVEEDKTSYTIRIDLNSADELKILKQDVDSISRRKGVLPTIAVQKAEPSREENILSRASRVRLGIGQPAFPDALKDMKSSSQSVFNIDIFWYRMRDADGNGFDFLTRFNSKLYNDPKINDQYVKSKFGITVDSGWQSNGGVLLQFGFGAGARYVRGVYAGGVLWQGYLLAYYQYSLVDLKLTGNAGQNHTDKQHFYNSNGIVGGAGVEIGLSSYIALFAEYTYGYSPAFSTNVNVEAGTVRIGATARTSFSD